MDDGVIDDLSCIQSHAMAAILPGIAVAPWAIYLMQYPQRAPFSRQACYTLDYLINSAALSHQMQKRTARENPHQTQMPVTSRADHPLFMLCNSLGRSYVPTELRAYDHDGCKENVSGQSCDDLPAILVSYTTLVEEFDSIRYLVL